MKVYTVWKGDYEDAYIDKMFATRELALAYIESGTKTLRRQWEAAERRTGQIRKGVFWLSKGEHGEPVYTPKVHKAPVPWEAYLASHDRGRIEEHEVLDHLR